MSPNCNLDTEDSNPIFVQNTPVYDDVSTSLVTKDSAVYQISSRQKNN